MMVDGTKFLLFQQPGLHSNTWFDKSQTYSLDCQVHGYVYLCYHNLTLY